MAGGLSLFLCDSLVVGTFTKEVGDLAIRSQGHSDVHPLGEDLGSSPCTLDYFCI